MKLERLISITYALLNNEVISASELADKYQVSQRTIYRDIEAIGAAGIPVVSYQGVNGGFGIIEEYKMDRSLLRTDDIQSLITLLHSTATVFKDVRAEETLHRLQTIRQGDPNPSLSLDFGSWRTNNHMLYLLRKAVEEETVIRTDYTNANNERTTRVIEPVSLHFKYYSWYLHGFCRERNDYRVFKLSRMTDVHILPERSRKSHASAPRDIWNDFRPEPDIGIAVIVVSGSSVAKALDIFYGDERQFNEDGSLTFTTSFNAKDPEWLMSVILGFGDNAVVLQPPPLKQLLREKIEKMLRRYSEV
ncbi:YafY family transcriptional regulator [Cohnella luojiensis]|uniref:YafY family transcriptional regulator n=1 Tax=Cohnella luojiensis TaxID=652876 RepID=A0A4Y8LYL8_9BACL|nr:YafY family transcriptional regulator [Cohnella luojiensis]